MSKLDPGRRICRSCHTRFTTQGRTILAVLMFLLGITALVGAILLAVLARHPVGALLVLVVASIGLSNGGSRWFQRHRCPKCGSAETVRMAVGDPV